MSVTSAAFYHLVEPEVRGCTVPALDAAIRMAAHQFCKRARCWRVRVNVPVTSTVFTAIQPSMPEGAIVVGIEAAWFDGHPLEPAPFLGFTPTELNSTTGRPRYITQREDGQLRIVPRATGTVVANLFAAPPAAVASQSAPKLPDFLLSEHAEAIRDGALARLLAETGRPWSNASLAAYRAAMFEAATDAAIAASYQGQQRARVRSRGHFM